MKCTQTLQQSESLLSLAVKLCQILNKSLSSFFFFSEFINQVFKLYWAHTSHTNSFISKYFLRFSKMYYLQYKSHQSNKETQTEEEPIFISFQWSTIDIMKHWIVKYSHKWSDSCVILAVWLILIPRVYAHNLKASFNKNCFCCYCCVCFALHCFVS